MIEIGHNRLINQSIAAPRCSTPEEVVALLGAVQAQDYAAALWAIGLRAGITEATVEQAIAARKIIRSWPMRGTLHFVAAADIHWILDLLAPRTIASRAGQMRDAELDTATISRCEKLFVRNLSGSRQLTRDAMMDLLEQNKISTGNQRGYHILWRLALEKLICFGPRAGKQHTFVLLDEWVPASRKLDREAALAEIARRYFSSHGPATVQDFTWWAGMKVTDARAALESVAVELEPVKIDGNEYWMPRKSSKKIQASAEDGFLLPGFDEYFLGYTDRSAVLHPKHMEKLVPNKNGRFLSTIVLNGQTVGTWDRMIEKGKLAIELAPFTRLTKAQKERIAIAANRYSEFLGMPLQALD